MKVIKPFRHYVTQKKDSVTLSNMGFGKVRISTLATYCYNNGICTFGAIINDTNALPQMQYGIFKITPQDNDVPKIEFEKRMLKDSKNPSYIHFAHNIICAYNNNGKRKWSFDKRDESNKNIKKYKNITISL